MQAPTGLAPGAAISRGSPGNVTSKESKTLDELSTIELAYVATAFRALFASDLLDWHNGKFVLTDVLAVCAKIGLSRHWARMTYEQERDTKRDSKESAGQPVA